MFKRKIYDQLVRWKNESDGETAILIDGARHIIVDFANPKASVVDVIRNDPGNLERFFKTIEYEYRVKLVTRNSLIVFDEVQLCSEARQMIKYLVADHRYDYLETGSLVSIEENVAYSRYDMEKKDLQVKDGIVHIADLHGDVLVKGSRNEEEDEDDGAVPRARRAWCARRARGEFSERFVCLFGWLEGLSQSSGLGF